MGIYPAFREDLDLRWSEDGTRLHLRDGDSGRHWTLTEPFGELLTSLDGETPPGDDLDMPPEKVFRALCLFEKYGFLEELPTFLCTLGTVLWLFPCRGLRMRLHSPVPVFLHRLLCLIWFPLLVLMLVRLMSPDFFLPRLEYTTNQSILCMVLALLPTLMLHELAHAAAANDLGIPVTSFGLGIHFFLPCFCTIIPELPYAPRRARRVVAKAGPLTNLCLGSLLLLLWSVPTLSREWMFWVGFQNILLCCANLLPLGEMDGARILTSFPAMERVWYGEDARRRTPWARFFEGTFARTLRILSRVGMALLIVLEAVNLFQMLWEAIAA